MASIEAVVFLSLLLDLLAFTIPLPLFPRIVQWFNQRECSDPNGLMSRTLQTVSHIRGLLYNPPSHSTRWDVVLLGGLMGSVFSLLQFIVSPYIGALSDKYGRRRILLLTLIGNILSALIWIKSTTFASYMLSRVVGGLSEGNVQLAIAILSDVSTPANRSKSLAFVGLAFAICFTLGPPIGAYYASKPLPAAFEGWGLEFNVYAVPALLTLGLLIVEAAFLYAFLPETRGTKVKSSNHKADNKEASLKTSKLSIKERLGILRHLKRLHFFFLCIFSGVEFTLTFLTFDLLDWTNAQNGKLLGSIGIISALLQGGYVRRSTAKIGEGTMAHRGIASCVLSFALLAILPLYANANAKAAQYLIGGASLCLAFTSATVVNSLTAFASLMCDDPSDGKSPDNGHASLTKGRALGEFRSSGQMGRAIGPLLVVTCYWSFGPMITYSFSTIAMLTLLVGMKVTHTIKMSGKKNE